MVLVFFLTGLFHFFLFLFRLVNLKQIDSQIFLQQNGFIRAKEVLHFRTRGLIGNNTQVQIIKCKECLFMDLGGVVVKEVYWRKLKVQSIVTFHWLSCGSLPLAELLLGEEDCFSSAAEVIN